MDVARFLAQIQHDDRYRGQLAHLRVLDPRPGVYAEPSSPLPEPLIAWLAGQGIERLYSHQVEALELARDGRDWVVVTGTASGKTLCYNLPIWEACLDNPETRALYLFPTKALAQDQLRGQLEALAALSRHTRLAAGVYDGDTPQAQRRRIRAEAQLVLSNPDMLHASILPYHPKWAALLERLRFVVVDEIHTYRGIFGAHVACVLRRLQRICRHYGSRPVFLSASATVGNPGELAQRLVGRPVAVIDQDGAPRGKKYFCFWNPEPVRSDRPLIGSDQAGARLFDPSPARRTEGSGGSPIAVDVLARSSATLDAVWLMVHCLAAQAQVLTFTRTRLSAELVTRYVQDELRRVRVPLADSVRTYRGGYLPDERREIESRMFAGKLRGIAATNALELGIDIGSLDAVIVVNYPGTIASAWQQFGRSGRRADESLAVLIAGNDPVDQFLMRHPEYFFSQTPEHAVVDPENPYVLARHLAAAAFELPLDDTDHALFGGAAAEIASLLAEDGLLTAAAGRLYFSGDQNPAPQTSLRHMSNDTFSIVLRRDAAAAPGRLDHSRNGRKATAAGRSPRTSQRGYPARDELGEHYEVLAQVDAISAPELIYPEAVYLHQGETFFVRQLDWEGRVAYVERHEMDYYTQAILDSRVRVLDATEIDRHFTRGVLARGRLDVSWQTVAFKKIKFETRENIGYGQVDLPPQNLDTAGFWYSPSDAVRQRMRSLGMRTSEGLCGLRNLMVQALPMLAMCDSRDISGVVDTQNFGHSAVILYDRYPGGLGYCERGFRAFDTLLRLCHSMVVECPCAEGCPSCVGLPNLRPAIHSDLDLMRGYPIPSKPATIALASVLLDEHVCPIVTSTHSPTEMSLPACDRQGERRPAVA